MRQTEPEPCGLCGRPFEPGRLTKHHCKPRSEGGTVEDIELICPACHNMIHATYTNETLAALYPTLDRLRRAPELQGYVKWVRKQPPTRRTRNRSRSEKL